MIYIFLKVILRGFKNHWAKKNNKSVRKKKKKILYREDKLGWKNAQIAQSAFQGSLSLLYYLQLLKRWDRESCFLLSPGCIYWWASWDRIWNCGCEGTLGLCPWVGRSRREQQGPCRAQSWCVWAFCATEGQLSRRGWGQTAALGTRCSVTGRVCGSGDTLDACNDLEQPGSQHRIPAVLVLHREKREAEELKAGWQQGPGYPGWGSEIRHFSAIKCRFTPLLLTASFFHLSAPRFCKNSC